MATTQSRLDYVNGAVTWIKKQRKTPTWNDIQRRFPVPCGLAPPNEPMPARAVFNAVATALGKKNNRQYKRAVVRLHDYVGDINAASGCVRGRRPLVFDVSELL